MIGNCPACDQVLIALELEGFEVDYCPACKGVWLDSGELELMAGRAGTPDRNLEREAWSAAGGKRGTRRCPRCEKRLEVIQLGPAAEVELDRCPRGHGLWLDRGELDHLILTFRQGQQGAVADFLADLFGKKSLSPGASA